MIAYEAILADMLIDVNTPDKITYTTIVLHTGLEPVRLAAQKFGFCVTTNFTNGAWAERDLNPQNPKMTDLQSATLPITFYRPLLICIVTLVALLLMNADRHLSSDIVRLP